jgi:putative membrane protein (TIGR04086 family)
MENLIESVKAAVAGVLLSVVFALLLALLARFVPLGETVLVVLAQTLKGISLAVGCFLFFRTEGGWKKGLLAGGIFTLLTYLSFSAIGGGFGWSWKVIIDLALGLGVGILSGIAAVNLKKA